MRSTLRVVHSGAGMRHSNYNGLRETSKGRDTYRFERTATPCFIPDGSSRLYTQRCWLSCAPGLEALETRKREGCAQI